MAGSLLPLAKQLALTDAAAPGVNYKFYTYEAGTLTPKATYSDSALTTPNANPVVANARGEVTMYGTGLYRIILKDENDATVWDRDNVEAPGVAATAAALAAPDGATRIGYGSTTVDAILDRSEARRLWPQLQHKNFAYDYSTDTVVVYDGSTGDGLHRHFGQIAEGINGRLHMVYGRSPTHGLTDGMTGWHRYSDDGGATWSAEVEVIPAEAGFDQRSLSMCVTPSGRILLIYAKVIVPSSTTNPTAFRKRYSDDNGATWMQGDDIFTVNYTYARTYGRIKLIPGDQGEAYKLVFTPYHRSSDTPDYKVAAWYSSDDGDSWSEGTAIINDTTGQTECEIVAINAKLWFAVTRGASGLTLYKTTNGGETWTSVGIVSQTVSDSFVAPTLDKFCHEGEWYLFLMYCNRANDTMVMRVHPVAEALSSSDFNSLLVGATDMVNASGYQCTVTKPDGSLYVDGGTAYVEFKEYVGQVYSQVRFVRTDLFARLSSASLSKTVASGAITLPESKLFQRVNLDTEGSAATDDLDTINGGRAGAIVIFQGPFGTSSRDVTLKNGTGNLRLFNDFRINTLDSWIALIKRDSVWCEIGRTNDHANPAAVISGDAITVPQSRTVIAQLIDTEGSAATDNLSTINGGLEGQIIILASASSSRDTTIKDNVGNIQLAGDFTLTNVDDTITLIKRGSTWFEISRSDNA